MTNGTEDARPQRTRTQISDWLLAEGWQLNDITDKTEGAAWALKGTDPRKKVVIFAQGAKKPDTLIMQAPIAVDETSQARLVSLGPEKNEALGWEIRFQLLNMGLKFAGLTLPLDRFGLILRVYTEDLGRNGFFDRLDRLQNGIFAAIWLIRKALAQPAPENVGTDALEVN
jgi:hypothetical protein